MTSFRVCLHTSSTNFELLVSHILGTTIGAQYGLFKNRIGFMYVVNNSQATFARVRTP